jgi:4-carboxymuconolactone decarboxylase
MSRLPELPDPLPEPTRTVAEQLTAARAYSDGHAQLPAVYAALLHHPLLAARVAALGEQIRFSSVLPDDVRELVILRYSSRQGYDYEWAHHQRPAALAGLHPKQVRGVASAGVPGDLRGDQRAAIRATDAICDGVSIPADVQQELIASHGADGLVELVVTCGLYAIMGYTVRSFDIRLEEHRAGPARPP